MKKIVLAGIALAALSSAAAAAPYKNGPGRVTAYERSEIQAARANLNIVKSRANADGRVTIFERAKIRSAQFRLDRALTKARRT